MPFSDAIRVGAAGASTGYEVARSLRFERGDSAYLARTAGSPTNSNKFSYSCWVKRTQLSTGSMVMMGGGGGSQTNTNAEALLYFVGSDEIASNYKGGLASCTVGWFMKATRKLRDTSSWYHLLSVWDGSQSGDPNRMKFFVNGIQEALGHDCGSTAAGFQYVNQNGQTQYIGRIDAGGGPYYSSFYLAEAYFVDGTACTPSDFIETDSTTGQIIPKNSDDVLGALTMGNNGFYLNFSDNSDVTSTTLGKDNSGNNNNWTPYNFSVSAGAGNDSLEDTPTNNFCTLNPLVGRGSNYLTHTNGNLDFDIEPQSTYPKPVSSFNIPTSGKWYAEWVFTTIGSAVVGVGNVDKAEESGGANQLNGINLLYNGDIRINDSQTQGSFTSWSANDVIGVKVDRDAGTIAFTLNGSAQGNPENISSMNTPTDLVFWAYRNAGGGTDPVGSVNFGQRPFSYLPTGYKALSSRNLPPNVPSIIRPQKHFETLLYTGNGSTLSVTGLEFKPDFVWIKVRSHSGDNHHLYDSVRGAAKSIFANTDDDEQTSDTDRLSSFTIDGFTLGNNYRVNGSGRTFVAWCWKAGGAAVSNTEGTITGQVSANTTAGFSIISYTGNGTAGATIGHGLGAIPQVVAVKRRNAEEDWMVGIGPVLGSGEEGHYVKFNSSAATATGNGPFNSTNPTSSLVTLGSDVATNNSGDTYIAYCWAEIPGYSKFGKYTGNGNADGPFIFTGFRPALIIIKKSSVSGNWTIWDNKRDSYNYGDRTLFPNSNSEEETGNQYERWDLLSNGFKLRANGRNVVNGETYIYMAFAEQPGTTPFDTFPNAR